MNLPSDTPRLPKWIFLAGDAALVGLAWLIWKNSDHPTAGMALVFVVACVVVAVFVGVIPFVTDYARREAEALDNRQRSLQALAVTIAAAAEQVSIAAIGLNGIAEAAQENASKTERLSHQIQEKVAALDARLAAGSKDGSEAAARLEAIAKKIAKAAAEIEATASSAAKAAPAGAIPEHPPVLVSRIVEIRPAVQASDPPFRAPAEAAAPAPVASPAPSPEPAAPPAAPAPRKRSPRKPAPEAPVQDLVLEAPVADESHSTPAAPETAEPAVSADGATRLVITAYIGIGNRLFIRGDGPGLSWEKGVPLTFISIGKWRWETNDASSAVRFKLYKNDEMECTALGERSIEPGAQLELTASF